MFFAYDPESTFLIERADGERETVKIVKSAGEDAGLDFETYLIDRPHSCANRCIFCFVDQLPRGLRDTLYFKDDDVRLSFLTGSYVTLTNMTEREIQRVIDLKISPINISVHTMDPELRCMMLGNKNAGRGIDVIRRFADAGIEMNCQIVCCYGVNDGEKLLMTMRELADLYPSVSSVSVIPVGLTKHREGLTPLIPYNRKSARDTVKLVEDFGEKCREKVGSRIFFCSDEFYLKAEKHIPDESFYEGYPQLENGVGLIRLLMEEFGEAIRDAKRDKIKASGTPFSVATGAAASPVIEKLLSKARHRFSGIDGRVYTIMNDFFGHSVDVAGLITGRDLIEQLRNRKLGKRLFITNRMLRNIKGSINGACG